MMSVMLFVALLPIAICAPTTSDFNQLKTEIKSLRDEIFYLKSKDQYQNGICDVNADKCGTCYCREDYNMIEKFYCDCRAKPVRRDCKDHYQKGGRVSGLYRINQNILGALVQVYCDQTTDGGGWTLIQRRVDGSTNFYRNWTEYKEGFGQLHREHWLGNELIYRLVAQAFLKGSEARFDMQAKGASKRIWAKYSTFGINQETDGYRLHVAGYSGTAGDKMSNHNGLKYTTYDRDSDTWSAGNCAKDRNGAWWYSQCTDSNLNSYYDPFDKSSASKSLGWDPMSIKFSEIKLRRK